MKVGLLFCIFMLSTFSCVAELTVEPAQSDISVPLGTQSIDTQFTLRNTGASIIRLQRIEANCPCVSAKSDTMEIRPGKTATLDANFDIGDRQGSQRKRITIYSDDPKNSVITLRWNIEVPRAAQIQPGFLLWDLDSKPETKSASFESLLPGAELRLQTTDLPFKTQLAKSGENFWKIEVLPKRTSASGVSRLPLQLVLSDGTQITFYLRLVISE